MPSHPYPAHQKSLAAEPVIDGSHFRYDGRNRAEDYSHDFGKLSCRQMIHTGFQREIAMRSAQFMQLLTAIRDLTLVSASIYVLR